jgi:hypothetical protein
MHGMDALTTPGFSNRVETEWLSDGRSMRLLSDLTFRDPRCRDWTAPEGSMVDGASIPRFFWRAIGSPFVGRYRRASVLHDVYCQTQSCPSTLVHRMFREAMRADGVGRVRAWLMWLAVQCFGPRF